MITNCASEKIRAILITRPTHSEEIDRLRGLLEEYGFTIERVLEPNYGGPVDRFGARVMLLDRALQKSELSAMEQKAKRHGMTSVLFPRNADRWVHVFRQAGLQVCDPYQPTPTKPPPAEEPQFRFPTFGDGMRWYRDNCKGLNIGIRQKDLAVLLNFRAGGNSEVSKIEHNNRYVSWELYEQICAIFPGLKAEAPLPPCLQKSAPVVPVVDQALAEMEATETATTLPATPEAYELPAAEPQLLQLGADAILAAASIMKRAGHFLWDGEGNGEVSISGLFEEKGEIATIVPRAVETLQKEFIEYDRRSKLAHEAFKRYRRAASSVIPASSNG